jgi:hypothetical protein
VSRGEVRVDLDRLAKCNLRVSESLLRGGSERTLTFI